LSKRQPRFAVTHDKALYDYVDFCITKIFSSDKKIFVLTCFSY
jgi:hypothetical protein